MADWQPEPEGLEQVAQLFHAAVHATSNEEHAEVYQRLDELRQEPEWSNYCGYLMANTDHDQTLRRMAGISLKNHVKDHWNDLHPDVREYAKLAALECIGDEVKDIRRTVSVVISTIAQYDQLTSWPGLLEGLVDMVDSGDANKLEGAVGTLSIICEDMPRSLDSDALGRPLNVLIPKFIDLSLHESVSIREYALKALNSFYNFLPQALVVSFEPLRDALFQLTEDEHKAIRKLVCQAFTTLIEMRYDLLHDNIHDVIRFMLVASQDENEHVAQEANEFWNAYVEAQPATDMSILAEYLEYLIPILMKGMQYGEEELINLQEMLEDQDVPDNPNSIAPRHYGRTAHGDEKGGKNAGVADTWNLRKSCANSLDSLAGVFGEHLWEAMADVFKENLESDDWLVRESAILALGAISHGCYEAVEPHLADLVPFLLQTLEDDQPLIRSITCWALGRYSGWVVNFDDDTQLFEPMLSGILEKVMDSIKKVQEAACSALATILDASGRKVLDYVSGILSSLMIAFGVYQDKNLLVLHDAIASLAEAVGQELARPEYIKVLMPPMMEAWNSLEDHDPALLPLLECLTAVIGAVSYGFQPFAEPVYHRCLNIVEQCLVQYDEVQEALANGIEMQLVMHSEFLVVSLDVVSALVENLGGSVESLIGDSNLIPLLKACMKDPHDEVRQSTFALLGDMAKSCYGHLSEDLGEIIPLAIANLLPRHISVCNNASWALGELIMKVDPDDVKEFGPSIMEPLAEIINTGTLMHNLSENAAITIGRVALMSPKSVAPHLENICERWFKVLTWLENQEEKQHAYRGLCAVVEVHPAAIVERFDLLCMTISSWGRLEDIAMRELFSTLLHSFKNELGDSWPEYLGKVVPQVQDFLIHFYGL